MFEVWFERLLDGLYRPLAVPTDTPEDRLLKALGMLGNLLSGSISMVFSVLLWSFELRWAAFLWGFWGAWLLVSLLPAVHSRRIFTSLTVAQLAGWLVIPFVVMAAAGGLLRLGYPVFALAAPIVALVYRPGQTRQWTLLYLGALLLAAVVEPFLILNPALPPVFLTAWSTTGALTSALVLMGMLYYTAQQRTNALAALERERALSERLLENILPAAVAQQLKNNVRVVADSYESASVLFADVEAFTPLSSGLTPNELVSLLDEVFSLFDDLVEKYGLEKIKTIGDCYMVAAGVPQARRDHAEVLTRLALEMRNAVDRRQFRGHRLRFRMGINSGPVIAGVIGRRKFIYDLWGDAVNTASRMESHGVSGQIQVTRATYEQIKRSFECVSRGTIYIKGKGEMEVFYVLREIPMW